LNFKHLQKTTKLLCRCVFPYFMLVVPLLFVGCLSPESLPVRDEKLVEVLADIHLAESALQSFSGPQKDSMAGVYYDQVMVIHGMDREVFDTCVAILRRNPDLMSEIYDKVYEHLEKGGSGGD